jgi:hypothetical protein
VSTSIGFAPEEIDTSATTRAARLKWVVVVNEQLAPGLAVNAAICAAAATSAQVSGILGPDAIDADGSVHPGLPWVGCSVLAANTETLRAIRAKADAHPEIFVADMTDAAQQTRVYNEWLSAYSQTTAATVNFYALSIVGPRNRVDRIVGRLPLLP